METKNWWESKIVVVNLITTIIMILTATEVLSVVPPDWVPYSAAIVTGLNIVLRVWYTNTAVKH